MDEAITKEKKILLKKINNLIHDRKEAILKKLPDVHEIDDGIIIRFFIAWDNCDDNNKIRYKKIENLDNPDEKVIFFYLPKGTFFELKKRDFIGCVICLNGMIEIIIDNDTKILKGYTKVCLKDNLFEGKALENSYLITQSKCYDKVE